MNHERTKRITFCPSNAPHTVRDLVYPEPVYLNERYSVVPLKAVARTPAAFADQRDNFAKPAYRFSFWHFAPL